MEPHSNGHNELGDGALQELVTRALEDKRYEWRTVEGVAAQTGASVDQVLAVLKKLDKDVVRSAVPDELGRALYTTRKHYRATHGIWDKFRSALSDKVA
jgi:hypothetical protein